MSKRFISLAAACVALSTPAVINTTNLTAIPLSSFKGESVVLLSGKAHQANGLLFPTIKIAKHHGYDPVDNALAALDDIFYSVTQDALRFTGATDGFAITPQHYAHAVQVTYVDGDTLSTAVEGQRVFAWFKTNEFLRLLSGADKEITSLDKQITLSLRGGNKSQKLHPSMVQMVPNKQVLASLQAAGKSR